MIAIWMLYCAWVASLIAVAARAAEEVLGALGYPRRWVWLGAMTLAVGLAILAPSRVAQPTAPEAVSPIELDPAAASIATAEMLIAEPSTPFPAPTAPIAAPLEEDFSARLISWVGQDRIEALDRGGWWIWLGLSATMLIVFAWAMTRSARARRRWPLTSVFGTRVRVAPNEGPAVMGALRPEIVLPQWLLARPEAEVRMALDHEREHVRAGDRWLLMMGYLTTAILPWNPAIWWIHSRLRLAVEMDCDRRVIGAGAPKWLYGSLLLDIASRSAPGRLTSSIAFAGAPSHLERRIRTMTLNRTRGQLLRALTAAGFAALALFVAFATRVPAAAAIGASPVSVPLAVERAADLPAPVGLESLRRARVDFGAGMIRRSSPGARAGEIVEGRGATAGAGIPEIASARGADGAVSAGEPGAVRFMLERFFDQAESSEPRVMMFRGVRESSPEGARPESMVMMRRSTDTQLGMISGTVRSRETGAPIVGAALRIEGAAPTIYSSATGTFQLLDVAPGTHWVIVQAAGFAPRRAAVTVAPGAPGSLNVSLSPGTADAPIIANRPRVEIVRAGAGQSADVGYARTPISVARVTREMLPPEVRARVPNAASGTEVRAFDVGLIGVERRMAVPDQRVGTITGMVRDTETGGPIVGAQVSLEGTSFAGLTSATGVFNLVNVPPGTYTIGVQLIGYVQLRQPGVVVAADATVTLSLQLAPAVLAQSLGQQPSASDTVLSVSVLDRIPALSNQREVSRALAESYPRVHLDAGVRRGAVTVEFVIRADGTTDPESIRVIRATSPEFGASTIEVVKRMEFTPGGYQGRNVPVRIQMPISWSLGL